MAIPANLDDLINCRVVESTRVEFKADWNPTPCVTISSRCTIQSWSQFTIRMFI